MDPTARSVTARWIARSAHSENDAGTTMATRSVRAAAASAILRASSERRGHPRLGQDVLAGLEPPRR
jgi:hypothetical protein